MCFQDVKMGGGITLQMVYISNIHRLLLDWVLLLEHTELNQHHLSC